MTLGYCTEPCHAIVQRFRSVDLGTYALWHIYCQAPRVLLGPSPRVLSVVMWSTICECGVKSLAATALPGRRVVLWMRAILGVHHPALVPWETPAKTPHSNCPWLLLLLLLKVSDQRWTNLVEVS